jgi:hypothetical protein
MTDGHRPDPRYANPYCPEPLLPAAPPLDVPDDLSGGKRLLSAMPWPTLRLQ